MKKIFLLFIFSIGWSLFLSQSFNKIDSLTSAKDAQKFIQNDYNKINYHLNVEDKINYDWYCGVISDSLKLQQTWAKADFDHNGLTDLLITGNTSKEPQTIYILDKGDHFESKKLNKGELYEKCSFSLLKGNKIEYYSVNFLNRQGFISNLIKKNLVYKYDDFIEENPNPKRHNILEIQYEANGSYWSRRIFEIEIVSNRDITWIIKNDDHIKTNVYTSKLSPEKFKQIVELLNYIDFENLEDEYEVAYSDASTNYLTITYDNLKVKKISDSGGMGTRGLRKLYDVLNSLKIDQNE